jgi:hypothetical protein
MTQLHFAYTVNQASMPLFKLTAYPVLNENFEKVRLKDSEPELYEVCAAAKAVCDRVRRRLSPYTKRKPGRWTVSKAERAALDKASSVVKALYVGRQTDEKSTLSYLTLCAWLEQDNDLRNYEVPQEVPLTVLNEMEELETFYE